MKKHLFLFAAAALALASCSSDDTIAENSANNQQKEIAFTAFTQPSTRAAIDGVTFTPTTMKVTAYDAEKPGVFFDATTFTKDATTWKAGKYWPLAPATINFLAIANANADNETGVTWGTNKADGVTIVMSDNSTAQRDLVYACGTGSVTQSGNVLTFPTNVPMTFYHAQAWIKFTVKANSSTEVSAITVNSITLNDVSCDGTYTITHTNWNKTKAERDAATPAGALNGKVNPGVWSSYDSNVDDIDVIVNGDYSALTTSVQDYGDLMVVPNQGIASFTINYTVDGNDYDYVYTPASTTLAQATKYVYNITFKLHEIEIAPVVSDWADGGSTTVKVYDAD